MCFYTMGWSSLQHIHECNTHEHVLCNLGYILNVSDRILLPVFSCFSNYNLLDDARPSQSHVPSAGDGNDRRRLRLPLLHAGTLRQDAATLGRWKRDDVRAASEENRRIPFNETGQFRQGLYFGVCKLAIKFFD